jgi:hypothetical protein
MSAPEVPPEVQPGDVIQLKPDADLVFGGCLFQVTEVAPWGVQGFVQIPGRGDAFYRARWADFARVGIAPYPRYLD